MRIILTISLIIVVAMLISPAVAQTPASSTVLPGCVVEANKANAGGTRITCPGSEWLGSVDNQGGKYVPGHKKTLNSNFSAGSRQHPGYVVIVADVGKGMIVDNGESHPKKLFVLQNRRYGPSEFRTLIRFERNIVLCNSHGRHCFNLYKRLK